LRQSEYQDTASLHSSRTVYPASPNLRNPLKQYDLFDDRHGHQRAVCVPTGSESLASVRFPKLMRKPERKMRLNKRFRLAVWFAALLLMLPTLVSAQSIVTGAVSGIVTDPSGAVIVGATLNLKNSATGEVLSTTSGTGGNYTFTLLKPGAYTVAVTQQGFKQTTEPVQVLLGQTVSVNFKLELGSGAITVEVTGQGAMLQTEDANITSNFETRQVENLPNPGGDITNIAQTAPGIAMNTTGAGYGNFSAFGLPGNANLFTVNGNDYNDPYLNLNNSGSSNLLLGGNELQEVAVVSNGYTGQYGRQAGAQIDYTTRGGTNELHGNLAYNWTGRALMANDYLNNLGGAPRPFANNNQWAARLGGPILKDKLFFFANTEGIRYILPTATTVFTPTPAYEAFVLAQTPIASDPTVTAFYQNVFNLYNSAPGISRAVPQAGSCGPTSTFTSVDPTGTCLQTWRDTGTNGNREWLVSGRVDYTLSDKDKLFGRVRFDRGYQPTYTDPINTAFNAQSIQPQQDGQLNYTHVFSPTIVNNFVGSVLYYSAVFQSDNISKALSEFPGILVSLDSSLTPLGSTSSNFPFAFFFPQGRRVTQYQLVDDLSIVHGNNTFKMGFNFRRVDWSDLTASVNTLYPSLTVPMGGFEQNQIFQPGVGGSVVQNFALNPEQALNNYSLGLYLQDELRVNSRLKFTLALRAERNAPGTCTIGCATRPIAPFGQMPHDVNIPFNQDFLSGFHQILPNVEKFVFEPRVGFAWTPLGDKTVFRGGVGLFTDAYPGFILPAYTGNFPQVNPFTIPAGTIAFSNPVAPGDTTSGAALAASCNAGFLSAYNSGGTLASYVGGNPECVDSSGNPLVANYFDPGRKVLNPKFVEWNFEVQRTIGTSTVVSANYVGNRGYDIILFNPYLNAYDVAGFGGLPTAPPDQRVATVNQLSNNGYSNYNGLSLSVRQTFWRGFTGQLNYTYSHALDNISNGGTEPFAAFTNPSIVRQIDPFNPKAQYGPADYDIRHYISMNYVWQLPFKSQNRLLDAAMGGWMISGTLYYHTGLPYSIIDGLTAGSIASENDGLATVLAQPIAPIPTHCSLSAILTPCFTPADFASPAEGFVGTLGRNAMRQTGYFNTDFSLRKDFRLTERMGFEVGANAYNFFNHANFQAPLANTNTGGAMGTILFTVTPPTSVFGAFANGVADARVVQIVGKFTF
jgi:hypothetical protein